MPKGVEILSVQEGSQAEKAGLLPGDTILKINAFPVHDIGDIDRYIALAEAGKVIKICTFVVKKKDERASRDITIDVSETLGLTFATLDVSDKKYMSPSNNGSQGRHSAPAISSFLYILAAVSVVAGVALCGWTWPGDPGYDNEWRPGAYTFSIMWLMAGIVEGVVFAAIGSGLSYLSEIAAHVRPLQEPRGDG